MDETAVRKAFSEWRDLLGEENILSGDEAQKVYGKNETVSKRVILAALKPKKESDVVGSVKVAERYKMPLYPFSTGNNWGYGAGTPVIDRCVVMDLSGMDRIVSIDPELGLVTVEPGVTTKKLREYLDSRGLPYLVPVSGGGPDVSIIGNAIERGYGVTPYVDHFSAVMSLKAVMPDGSLYSRAIEEMGCPEIDRSFKWGLGPYIDGLFSQGSYGIVTEMTIALAPIPERVTVFLINLPSEELLEEAVGAVHEILKHYGNVLGSINIMNAQRVLSMVESYPFDQVRKGSTIPEELVHKLLKKNYLSPLTVGGIIYGQKGITRIAKGFIRKRFKGIAKRSLFFTRSSIDFLKRVSSFVPSFLAPELQKQMANLDESFKVAEGTPSEIALPLCYWKAGKRPKEGRAMNPAKDDCGVIWYSPLVPMKRERVRKYFSLVKEVCVKHGIEPLITLTSLSFRCFDSTVPILFDPLDNDETARAKECYLDLFESGRREGYLPYRLGIEHMDLATSSDNRFFRVAKKIKKALDPHGIISPGRYCPR